VTEYYTYEESFSLLSVKIILGLSTAWHLQKPLANALATGSRTVRKCVQLA